MTLPSPIRATTTLTAVTPVGIAGSAHGVVRQPELGVIGGPDSQNDKPPAALRAQTTGLG